MEPLDIDLIARAMHSTDIGASVSPDGASVVMSSAYDSFEGDEEPDEDWYWVPRATTAEEYEDMVAFADVVGDSDTQERLRTAMTGTGAFRRFRQAVYDDPTQIGSEWGVFQDARQELRALDWLGEVQLLDEATLATLVAERLAVIRDIEVRLAGVRDREFAQVQDLERELQSPAAAETVAAWSNCSPPTSPRSGPPGAGGTARRPSRCCSRRIRIRS